MTSLIWPWRAGNMYHGSVNHGSSCFVLMVVFGYHVDSMDPICQQTSWGSIMMWGLFMWHGLDLLVCQNISLTGDHYVVLLHLHPFVESMYTSNDGVYSSSMTHRFMGSALSNILDFQRIVSSTRSHDMSSVTFSFSFIGWICFSNYIWRLSLMTKW